MLVLSKDPQVDNSPSFFTCAVWIPLKGWALASYLGYDPWGALHWPAAHSLLAKPQPSFNGPTLQED